MTVLIIAGSIVLVLLVGLVVATILWEREYLHQTSGCCPGLYPLRTVRMNQES